MAVFQLGSIIRNRREELRISQEDLADGICSVPTLSRIENGERMPTKNHYEMLMQRLGYSAMSLDFFTDKRDFQIHELKFKIRQAYVGKKYAVAKEYLQEFERLLREPTQIDRQFSILYATLLNQDQYSPEEKLGRFETALLLTCPRYICNSIPHVLSYEEIILLNNIAICCEKTEKRERAISILYTLKEYYDHHIVNSEEAIRTQPMVLYNLSKVLGLAGRYDECIEVCDLGIRVAKNSGRYTVLGVTLFNRAWAHLQRQHEGDADVAKRSFRQAFALAKAIEDQNEVEYLRTYFLETFSEQI